MKNMISTNLQILRKLSRLTQEEVAEKINVSRQAVAKWENGDSLPDISNCAALSKLFDVSLDHMVNGTGVAGVPLIPPKGKHAYGTVTVGERGQIVIPKKARDTFAIRPGDSLMVLGDENQGGLAIMKVDHFLGLMDVFMEGVTLPGKTGGDRTDADE